MFICYADESGYTGAVFDANQRYIVTAVLANTYNMHRTQLDFGQLMARFHRLTGHQFREVKAEEFYAGRGAWARVDGEDRHAAHAEVLTWLSERRHQVSFSAIDTRPFFDRLDSHDPTVQLVGAPYVATALQIGLMVQRKNQDQPSNKGKTLIIYDQQGEFEERLAELLSNPPGWTDAYYGYTRGDRLDQIVDTAYFVRSHHASLIQLADMIAFVLRLYVALSDGGDDERYRGERDRIAGWLEIIRPRLFERRHRLPSGSDPLATMYRELCPPSVRDLQP